jgi:fructokinase
MARAVSIYMPGLPGKMGQCMMESLVVGIGEILWDMLPEGRQLGGAPANFAFHVHAQGIPATVVSCVGQDALGEEIRERLAAWDMDTRYVEVLPDFPTGTVTVTLDAAGVPQYIIHEGVAWDQIRWREELGELAAKTRAVCFGSLGQRSAVSRETIQRFLREVPADCLRVFDINLRQSYFNEAILSASLASANVLKLNHEELPIVAALFSLNGSTQDILQSLLSRYSLDLIAVTRGGQGSLLITPDAISEHPGYPVKVVDTVGAGDAFTAVLVVGLLQGESLDAVNDKANRRAADVCSHAGATS